MRARPLPPYAPPTGDEPLDAVEEELVRMWIDILLPLVCEETVRKLEQPDHQLAPERDAAGAAQ